MLNISYVFKAQLVYR